MNWISRRRYDNSQSPHLWWITFQSVMSLLWYLDAYNGLPSNWAHQHLRLPCLNDPVSGINKHSVCWVKPFVCMTGDGNNFVVFGGGRSAVCTCAFQTEGNMYSYILQSQWRFLLFLHSFCAMCTFFLMIHMHHIPMHVHNHCRFENGCFCTSFVKKMCH